MYHLWQSASVNVPRQDVHPKVAADALLACFAIRTVFYTPDRATADDYLTKIIQKHDSIATRLAG
jgi:hypothetical protein